MRKADKLGWRGHFGPALITAKQGTSGGTAVLARKGPGTTPHDRTRDGFEHRIAGAWIGAVVRGGIHCFSVYLKDCDNLGDTNAAILTELAALVGAVRGPWVVGGDWNMEPRLLQQSNWMNIVQGQVHAPTEATCNGKTYDYFVTSRSLTTSVVKTVKLHDTYTSLYWAARLYIRGDARHKAVRRLVRPHRIPPNVPHGPLNKQAYPEPTDPDDDISLADGFAHWYSNARTTWHSLLGTSITRETHRFRWEPVAGRITHSQMGATEATAELRAMEARLREATLWLSNGATHLDPRIRLHLSRNRRCIDKEALKHADISTTSLTGWCNATEKAIQEANVTKLNQLATVLKKKADAMDKIEATLQQRNWRKALTADTRARPPVHGNKLSRIAFRWIKGINGWSRSTVGNASEGDHVPNLPPGSKPIEATPTSRTTPGCNSPAPRSDQAEVDHTAQQWADLWNAVETYISPNFDGADDETLPPLTVDAIRRAAMSFPTGTGLGADNISPRAFARLTDQQLQELANLLMKAESDGHWSQTIPLVLIVLLLKDDGGFRPICLFPTIIRIWMRARVGTARQWEDLTAAPELLGKNHGSPAGGLDGCVQC